MANLILLTNILFFASCFLATPNSITTLARKLKPPTSEPDTAAWFKVVGRSGNEKLAQIHFYVHDELSGDNRTVYEVSRASITSESPTTFGHVRVLDDRLTVRPEPGSEEIGRTQGFVTSADLRVTAMAMNLNFYFTSGKCNGSTISILGRNQLLNPQRELAVVGGTGIFRFARGYALTSTYSYDVETGNSVLEYTMYVKYAGRSGLEQLKASA